MNPMHKALVTVAAASSLFVVSSMAHADGPVPPSQPPATVATSATPATSATSAPAVTTEEAQPVAKRSPFPLVTIITGAVVFTTGLCFFSLSSTESSIANTNSSVGNYAQAKKDREDSKSHSTTGAGLAIGGALVASGGFLWFFIDGMRVRSANDTAKTTASSLRVAPAVGPGSTGAYLTGTF